MPTEKAAGAQTATVTTEHELTSITDAGNYMLIVDCTNMVLGDRVVLRLKGDSRAAEILLVLGAGSVTELPV